MSNRNIASFTRWVIPGTLVLGSLVLACCFLRTLMAEEKKPGLDLRKPADGAWQAPPDARAKLRYQGKTFEEWRKRLETELEPKSRIEAINAMIAFGVNGYASEATQALGKSALALKDVSDEADKVRDAFKKIVELGKPAVDFLLDAVESNDAQRIAFALDVLTNVARVRSIPDSFKMGLAANQKRLLHLARHKDFDTALTALQLLDNTGDPTEELSALMVDFLGSDDVEKRNLALWRLPDEDTLLPRTFVDFHPPVTHFYNTPENNRYGLYTLKPKGAAVVPVLIWLLNDSDENVRTLAVRKLACYHAEAKEAAPELIKRLQRLINEEKDATLTKTSELASVSSSVLVDGIIEYRIHTIDRRFREHHYLIHTLGAIGPDAKAAVPLMKKMLQMPYADPETIIEALVCVDPFGTILMRKDSK